MAEPTAVTAVLPAVLFGYLLWRCVSRWEGGPGAIAGTVLWAVAGSAGWMSLLALAGIAWRPWLLLLPLAVAAPVALLSRPGPRRPGSADAWTVAACAAVAPRALAVALTPAYGWDFRYLWGLKAEVFAAARGLDAVWLAWPPLADLHPSYPPLWPELLAAGRLFGGEVGTTAAIWSALLVVGLAAVGWDAARDASRPVQALAAAALAWTPVLFRPDRSGYAEPVVAFLLAVALAALAAAVRQQPGALTTLAVAAPALALAKNEGLVLALACVAAAAAARRRSAVPAVLLTVAVAVSWRLTVMVGDFPRPDPVRDLDVVLERVAALPGAVAATLTPAPAWLLLAWLLLVPTLVMRQLRAPATVLVVWATAAAVAYLTTPWGFAWHLTWSLDRVVAVALPGALAVALPTALRRAGAPPGPGRSPGG